MVARSAQLVIGWLLVALAVPAAAQVLPDAVQACRKEPDDARRLACFDRETAKYPLTAEQSFGLSASKVAALQEPPPAGREAATQARPAAHAEPQLRAKVAALRERAHAGFLVTLDNGQVWSQNEMDSHSDIRPGDLVVIKPGRLGGFWLVGPSGWSTRVRRIK